MDGYDVNKWDFSTAPETTWGMDMTVFWIYRHFLIKNHGRITVIPHEAEPNTFSVKFYDTNGVLSASAMLPGNGVGIRQWLRHILDGSPC